MPTPRPLGRLIDRLADHGISISWAQDLAEQPLGRSIPGVYVDSCRLLVLSASAGNADLMDACQDALRIADPRGGLCLDEAV